MTFMTAADVLLDTFSVQFITVPFKSLLIGLMDNTDISGELEFLEKVIKEMLFGKVRLDVPLPVETSLK